MRKRRACADTPKAAVPEGDRRLRGSVSSAGSVPVVVDQKFHAATGLP